MFHKRNKINSSIDFFQMKVYKIQNEKEEIIVDAKQFISKSCSHSEKKFIIYSIRSIKKSTIKYQEIMKLA
jgi:hypothetical protein